MLNKNNNVKKLQLKSIQNIFEMFNFKLRKNTEKNEIPARNKLKKSNKWNIHIF